MDATEEDYSIRACIAFIPFFKAHIVNVITSNIHNNIRTYDIHRVFSISYKNAFNNAVLFSTLKRALNPIGDGKFFYVESVYHIFN